MDAIQSAIAKKEILDGLRPIDTEREQRIMQKFRLDWNYHSNHIEGNSLSYGETKALILFNITAQGKPLKDHFEIKGHNDAIDWIMDVVKGKYELTEKFIRELHLLILKEDSVRPAITADGKPTTKRIEVGKYKTSANHVQTVTGEIFYFATPEETPAKMHDLLAWYHEQRKQEQVNAILLAAEFHYRFIRIHPFDDGNGRLARILMNFILMQYDYPPVVIRTEDKENYYRTLQQADAGIITPFIEYIAGNLSHSLDIMIAGANGESIEEPDDIDKEILLLEQQINNTNRKIEFYRNEGIIQKIIDGYLSRLPNMYISRIAKLSPYYKNSSLMLQVDENKAPYDDSITLQKNINYVTDPRWKSLTLDFHKLYFIYDFYSFLPLPNKKVKIEFKDFKNVIKFEFYAVSYQLSNSLGDKVVKYYDEELTDEEIDSIIKKEVLRHLRFIDEKIKEAENTN